MDMKAKKPKELFSEGTHTAVIKSIKEGLSVNGTPFFSCHLENEYGRIVSTHFVRSNKLSQIVNLFKAAGIPVIPNSYIETNDLINKKINFEVKLKVNEKNPSRPFRIAFNFNAFTGMDSSDLPF